MPSWTERDKYPIRRNRRGFLKPIMEAGVLLGIGGAAVLGIQECIGKSISVYKKTLTKREDGTYDVAVEGVRPVVVGVTFSTEGNRKGIEIWSEPSDQSERSTVPLKQLKALHAVRVAGQTYPSLNAHGINLGTRTVWYYGETFEAGLWFRLTNMWGENVGADGFPSQKPQYVRATSVTVVKSEQQVQEDIAFLEGRQPHVSEGIPPGDQGVLEEQLAAPQLLRTPQPVK